MKSILFFLSLTALTLAGKAQSNFAGDWEGKVSNFRLILHITGSDKLSATLDSPDQGAKGLNCDVVTADKDSIHISLSMAGVQYDGKLSNDKNAIAGTWKQRGASIPVSFNKGAAPVSETLKPQTPRPPFHYQSKEVEYDNKDKTLHYGATLTIPQGKGPFPAAIIISGSGSQDRDGSMFGHKPYMVLADYLTRNGIAVLRVDDRGIGKSTAGANISNATSADFANDVETSFAYLQSRPEIDKKNIGLIGHSEGGQIAPIVAARNKAVAFIVLLAGPGQKGDQILNFQMQRAFEQPGLAGADKQTADSLVNAINDLYKQTTDLPTIQAQIKTAYAAWKANVPDNKEKKLWSSPQPDGFLKMSTTLGGGLHWLQYFLTYDPAQALQQVSCPVLALNGGDDVQVVATENLPLIEAALKKGGNKHYTIKEFPHLNHLFQTTPSKNTSYENIEETFSPEAMAFISQWIHEQVK